jgi:hypothetical protein
MTLAAGGAGDARNADELSIRTICQRRPEHVSLSINTEGSEE